MRIVVVLPDPLGRRPKQREDFVANRKVEVVNGAESAIVPGKIVSFDGVHPFYRSRTDI
jgi:hypothetical protein